MEVSAALGKMQAELLCPVCLDYFNDPVTINCGHNFCDACIRMSWKDLRDRFPCPVCRQPCQKKHVSANGQLGRLVDLAKLLQGSRSSETVQGEECRCEEHNQGLSLFCEDDQELVCPLCAQHPAHQGHNMKPMAEAAAHHRQTLSGYIKPLKKQLSEMLRLVLTQDRSLLRLKREVREQRSHLASEFEQLTYAMESELAAALGRLTEEDKRLQKQFIVNIEACREHRSIIQGLLREVTEKSVMFEEMMLREIRGLHQRYKNLKIPFMQPLRFRHVDYSLPPLYSELSTIIQKFQENVSLDPQTSHPSLQVSEDKKSVTYMKETNMDGERETLASASELVVLGREGFTSGRHYWEVQVGDKPEWAVGVCSDDPRSEAQRPLARPKRCWTIQLQDGDYLAVGSVVVPLTLKDKPTGIGIYLDCELKQVSFYNSSDRSHLHSFTETFAQVLKPYFCMGPDSTPLTVGAERV